MKRQIYLSALLLCLLISMNASPASSATIDPSFRFSTIETEHFIIHFHQGEEELADKLALISEDVNRKLSEAFLWAPPEKTRVVLIDNSDFANGFANVLPYNIIYIVAVPPRPDMTIGEYDNWLEMVFIHEYTHILTMDTSKGYAAVTRSVFGKTLPGYDPLSFLLFLLTAPPNVFLPDWWLEGAAVWAESEFTPSGRGKSSYVEMIFRMAVAENNIPRVDQINGDVPYWPSGNLPYLYGMLLEKHVALTYGKDKIGELSSEHAGRLPFMISAPPQRLTGLNYARLYRDAVKELKEDQSKKIEYLKSKPFTKYTGLKIKGERVTNPRLSPDGRYIAANRKDPHRHEEIIIVDTNNFKEISRVRRLPSDSNVSWAPDSRKLYFTQAELRYTYNLYQDVYSYDLVDRSVKRVTKDLRAKDVDVSPDGKDLAFVMVGTGRQSIAVLKAGSDKAEPLTDLKDSALSSPKWSPDGKSIVFSKHDNSGQVSIELLNVETKTVETLLLNKYNNVFPTWSPDGKFVIFTSDRTGVFNLFAYSIQDKKLYQISHVLGGAFQPDVSREANKILFSAYSSKGFYLSEMSYDPSQWSETLSPRINIEWDNPTHPPLNLKGGEEGLLEKADENNPPSPPFSKGGDTPLTPLDRGELTPPLEKGDEGGFSEQAPVEVSEKKPYCPLPSLLPKFWLPTLTADHEGAVFGAFTAGQDVLGYHTYTLQGGYGVSHKGYFDVNYVYDRWYPTFFARWYSAPVSYSEFFNDNDDYFERRSGLTAGVSMPLYSTLEKRLSLVAGYNTEISEQLTDIDNRKVDGLEVFEGRRSSVFTGLRYRDALKYPYSISREEGRDISLSYRNYSENVGSDLSQSEYTAGYEEFIGVGKHHVIYLNFKGATAGGDRIAQQAYGLGGISSAVNQYSLRGFASGFQTGKHLATASLEYRFPVKYIFRGPNTKPFFWDRLHVAAFTDAGDVWGDNRKFEWDEVSVGLGAEVRLDMVLGYKLKITPALGIAQGITDDGETQVYITIYSEL
ncbi:MAG: PD40 domain-containing protein [Nitrospirae bacterium]|nr:PD40 domain-containing protein [Nitrospirota bacterium]